jgi:hypothetical protein
MVTPEDLGQRGHPRARGSSGTRQLGQHGSTAARQHGSTADLSATPVSALLPARPTRPARPARPPRSRPCLATGPRLGLLGHPRSRPCLATGPPRPARPRGHPWPPVEQPDTPQRLRASLPTPRPGPAQSPRAAPNGRQRTTQRHNGAHTEVPERGSAPAGWPVTGAVWGLSGVRLGCRLGSK